METITEIDRHATPTPTPTPITSQPVVTTTQAQEDVIVKDVLGIAICPRGINNESFVPMTWDLPDDDPCIGKEIFGGNCGGIEYRCKDKDGADFCCRNHLLACGNWLTSLKKEERDTEATLLQLYRFCSNGIYKTWYNGNKTSGKPRPNQVGWKEKVRAASPSDEKKP